MDKVTIEDIDNPTRNPADTVSPLSEPLNTAELAITYYVLAPDERFSYVLHRHHDQEEVFYIQTGTVTFETETDEVDVEAGEVIRFAPGEFQLGTNRGDERVTAIALGAPRESRDIDCLLECSECDERTVHSYEPAEEEDELIIRCTDCGTESRRD